MIPADIQRRFDEALANRRLGFRLEAAEDGSARLTMPVEEDHLQEGGVVHGGILSALADSAAVYALFPALGDRWLTSIEFKVNFLNAARLGGGDVSATSRVVKRGRTVALVDVEVTQGDQPILCGLFTYLLMDRPEE